MAENLELLLGDCRAILPTLEAGSVQCCVTSPPYWGLRDYGTAQWEGGDEGCDHVMPPNGGRGKATTHSVPNYEILDRTNQYRQDCDKCGARRIDSQLGLEETPSEYITNMVAVFREVWRVLRDDGTLWLNLGDSYAGGAGGRGDKDREIPRSDGTTGKPSQKHNGDRIQRSLAGLKPKDLCMMPARLAMALQADGWYLRSDIIWAKPNPMPESVTDRPTKAHEYIFLLTKNGGNPLIWQARDSGEWSYKPNLEEVIQRKNAKHLEYTLPNSPQSIKKNGQNFYRLAATFDKTESEEEVIPRWKGFDYFYDAEAIREPHSRDWSNGACGGSLGPNGGKKMHLAENDPNFRNGHSQWERNYYPEPNPAGRNKRTVWTIATQPYAEAHFATFPEEIPKLCILAGSKPGDVILDPFAGSGTVGKVAIELGRRAVLIELNPGYIELAQDRTFVTPGFF